MEKDWEVVRSFGKLYLAEIAIEALKDNGINGVILNQKDSSYHAFGDIELYVHVDDLEKAKDLLKDFD
jgi:hypothetical protein